MEKHLLLSMCGNIQSAPAYLHQFSSEYSLQVTLNSLLFSTLPEEVFFPWLLLVSYTQTYKSSQHCIALQWPHICVHLWSSSSRQLRTVSGCCLCRARCSGGIWGFLFFIPSLSCYCILSIVSMRDLLSLGCHTSWPAAKKVSGRESCHSH